MKINKNIQIACDIAHSITVSSVNVRTRSSRGVGLNEHSVWHRLERGQAMSEYWPTIPAGIAIMILAGVIGSWVSQSFLQTVEGLNRAGLPQEICNTTDAEQEENTGPTFAQLGPHSVALTSVVYDESSDTTTVVYSFTSNPDAHAISNKTANIPWAVYNNRLDLWEVDEDGNRLPDNFDYVTDPKEGAIAGLKSDNGQEPDESAKAAPVVFKPVAQYETIGETYDIFLVLSGQYEFEAVEVNAKYGTDSSTGTISAPVRQLTQEELDQQDPDSLYEGCQS